MRCLITSLVLLTTLSSCTTRPTAQGEPPPPGLTLHVTVPPDAGPVYLSGNLPELGPWNPGKFPLHGTGPTRTTVLALPPNTTLEFKFTLGSWQTVETTSAGQDIANRTFTMPDSPFATFATTVAAFRAASSRAATRPASTASPNVSILHPAFPIPQLDRTRRIWIYLPPDYATSTKTYPVIYMHDGQNVFDAVTSFSGEWGVDETLDQLHTQGDHGAIVVAIDNGGAHRLGEYSPWRSSANPRYGGGDGD